MSNLQSDAFVFFGATGDLASGSDRAASDKSV